MFHSITLCRTTCAVAAIIISTTYSNAHGDTFGSGINEFEIEFVTIGNPGNLDDPNGFPQTDTYETGAVPYTYRIGKYEISEEMVRNAIAASAGSSSPLDITLESRGPDKPASGISWIESARFVNWLNTSSGYSPAYKFGESVDDWRGFEVWEPGDPGFNPENPYRNSQARYVIPSLNEWHKAAYYDPATEQYFEYPTGSNVPPIPVQSGTAGNTAVYMLDFHDDDLAEITQAGGLSPYGTMAQGGNAIEWVEDEVDLINDGSFPQVRQRGGKWSSSDPSRLSAVSAPRNVLFAEQSGNGLRVASVPEPHSFILLLLGAVGLFTIRNSRN